MAIIQIQDVSKKFQTKDGEIDALKHVTLDIEAGDIYGIIGMSGAGKSTLVRCINHIEVPTEGTVIVQDKDLSKLCRERASQAAGTYRHDLPAFQSADAEVRIGECMLPIVHSGEVEG